MFIFFGYGTKRQDLGPGETRRCPRCNNTTQWERLLQFQQVTVFFIPVARWKHRHLEICGICGALTEA